MKWQFNALEIQCLNNWIRCGRCNPAMVPFIPSDSHVAILTPIFAPAIFQQEIITSFVICPVANGQHCMIYFVFIAFRFIVNARWVIPKWFMCGIDGHRNGSNVGDSLLQYFLIAIWNVHIATQRGYRTLSIVFTMTTLASVWIHLIRFNTAIFFDPIKGLVSWSAITFTVAMIVGAIDQILRW